MRRRLNEREYYSLDADDVAYALGRVGIRVNRVWEANSGEYGPNMFNVDVVSPCRVDEVFLDIEDVGNPCIYIQSGIPQGDTDKYCELLKRFRKANFAVKSFR